jgi:hypothetical protein
VKKLILLSLLFATLVLPGRASKDPIPQRGLQRALRQMAVFYVVYWLALLLIINRLN